MPAKNTIKLYLSGGYYHIYNRGVEKRSVFSDRDDYTRFLHFLKLYLSPAEDLRKEFPLLRSHIVQNNLNAEVELLAFCLMPNHYHLLVKQNQKDGITKLTRALITSYSMYFNKKYERVGPLFQGIYKAANIDSDEYLLHVSRYIHLNPIARGISLDEFEWSSYLYYLDQKHASWLNTKTIKDYFNENNKNLSYRSFVEDSVSNIELTNDIVLDSE